MRTLVLPPMMLLALALALYLLPDGALSTWRLALHGALARLSSDVDDTGASDALERIDIDRELTMRLAQKDAELADARRQLRDFGLTRETVPGIEIIPARVVGLGAYGQPGTFTVDIGLASGTRPGDAVVVGQVLVGVVAQVGASSSLVLSLSSPGCYISARVSPTDAAAGPADRELCAVSGDGKGGTRVIAFGPGTSASEGWLILTSGLEAGVPEGLMIGEVGGGFSDGSESGTVEAPVKTAVDPAALDYVAVLKRKRDA